MHRLMERLARVMAILGGLVLTALILLTCVSVLGRGANTLGHSGLLGGLGDSLIGTGVGPVTGDFELVEAGIAFAIFAFLPICQIRGAHATVDVFASLLPKRVERGLIAFWEVALAAMLVLICWRLGAGMIGKRDTGEITFLLQFPIWWAYAASFAASAVAALVGVWCAWARVAGLVTGRDPIREAAA